MQYTINQLYDLLHEKVNDIYNVFKNFFGEEHTDLQEIRSPYLFQKSIEYFLGEHGISIIDSDDGIFNAEYEISDDLLKLLKEKKATEKVTIYVWWSNVTVTNENDKSVDIQDLYAKIEIQLDGRIPYENRGFLLNRATYTEEQFLNNYMHSHVADIPKSDFSVFQPPCLGRGPINNTIGTLKNEYDETMWMLFCDELGMYVTVESLVGVPWNYLEKIGRKDYNFSYIGYNFEKVSPYTFISQYSIETLKDFIKYYLQHGHLTLSYSNGKFFCSMPYCEYIIDISNAFIDFYNTQLKTTKENLEDCYYHKLLNKVMIADNKIYLPKSVESEGTDLSIYQGKFVLNFKGKEICTRILPKVKSEASISTVLDHNVSMYILKNILRTINFKYKNEYYKNTRSTEAPATTNQRVFYI